MKKESVVVELDSKKKQLRLLNPYHEEMYQRFGLFISIVAKPVDILEFASKIK